MPSKVFLRVPLDLRTATTTAVPTMEHIVADDTARNKLFQMEAIAFGVLNSS